jgi:hypothetical protein
LLSPGELALPAVCGQTSKLFLMVVRRQERGALELIRAVVIEPSPAVSGLPGRRPDFPPRAQARVPSRVAPSSGAGGRISKDPDVSFQALTMSGRIVIGRLYEGCPYCRAHGYFRCGCGMFSCWNRHNRKPHSDHSDVWCEACHSWKCTSEKDKDDHSLSELTAYATRESTPDLQSRIAPGSTRREQITRSTSIRGYLK